MRVESSVTSVSWIPSEAIEGMTKLPFQLGITHYDEPPPDTIDDIEALHAEGRFRFANVLRAWIEVEDGEVVDGGHLGRSFISSTLVRLKAKDLVFQPSPFHDLRQGPEISRSSARFVQSAGGRPGVPAPRRIAGRPWACSWSGPTCGPRWR